eukprot:TRINITY_DN3643_c0_g1_i1.p1 TRINITY_DN3643_c0_g1~~TRINITY_DN3643_c0_g1_i1.p1  ORF type:complete len:198 (-),score=17.38 TRINITY_DN3643_c0_g1_i1:35-601(-)
MKYLIASLILSLLIIQSESIWTKSSFAVPVPRNALMLPNATLNPVPVYICSVKFGSKSIPGGLAYEGGWRCVYYNQTAPTSVSWVGPGYYSVYVDTFGTGKGVEATPQAPFPSGTITPFFSEYEYATGCQSSLAVMIDGFAYYFPTYGTALPDAQGNFRCYSASFRLYSSGKFIAGSLPYYIGVDNAN